MVSDLVKTDFLGARVRLIRPAKRLRVFSSIKVIDLLISTMRLLSNFDLEALTRFGVTAGLRA